MKMIPFFTDDIAIVPHTGTFEYHLNRPVSIAEFAKGEAVSLYEKESGELYVSNGRHFMTGPEVKNCEVEK